LLERPHEQNEDHPIEAMTAENKCGYCTNPKCCTYISQQIATPRSRQDIDFLLWQIPHRDIRLYTDEGSCAIYHDRPQICRDYSNDSCEFDAAAEDGFELYFDGYETLLKYCRTRFKRWGQRPY
jgi:hypothetical protein